LRNGYFSGLLRLRGQWPTFSCGEVTDFAKQSAPTDA